MIKWLLRIGAGLGVAIGILFWWLLLSGSDAAKTAPGVFDINDWRERAAAPNSALPTEIKIIEIGRDMAPPFAVQAGRFGAPIAMTYNAVEITYPNSTIIVGGSIDRATAETMTQSVKDWVFDDAAYARLTDAMLSANQVLMTHEHLDHIIAIARHPSPDALARNLVLNAPQIKALPMFAVGELAPALRDLEPRLDDAVRAIAPGVVAVPAAGHTPGSQNIFITLANGQEVLLIGDTVWNIDALKALKTRPILTQYVVFRPNYEDREAVKRQVRALYEMMKVNPQLIVLPAHDRAWVIEAAKTEGISFFPAE